MSRKTIQVTEQEMAEQREAARREMLLHSCVDTGIRAAAPVCRRLQDRNVRRGGALQQRVPLRGEGR